MITFTNVTKRYPDGTVAVDDLSLDVPDGSLTVFVGPSGCGKTTSMRMINRMVEPTSGTVTVDGRDVSGVDPVKLRLGIGYVIQSGGLMPHQRVIDNVATVPVLQGKSRREARHAAYAVLERVGLDPKLAERYPAQLSGGQQQRVGVARALAADPPILLMDEPFSAVDPVVREELQSEILRLQSELRKTIVFVTHDIDEAVKLGDAVAVFGVGGTLQQYDSPARLLSNPANDFVSEFIGADRGYRLMQFFSASTLELGPVATVTEDEIERLYLAPDEWRLVVRDDGSPFGWIDADGTDRYRDGMELYDSVTAGGSLYHPDSTLRAALDAALSSPSGIGVAVDESGAVLGGAPAEDVVDAMETQRRVEAAAAAAERAQLVEAAEFAQDEDSEHAAIVRYVGVESEESDEPEDEQTEADEETEEVESEEAELEESDEAEDDDTESDEGEDESADDEDDEDDEDEDESEDDDEDEDEDEDESEDDQDDEDEDEEDEDESEGDEDDEDEDEGDEDEVESEDDEEDESEDESEDEESVTKPSKSAETG